MATNKKDKLKRFISELTDFIADFSLPFSFKKIYFVRKVSLIGEYKKTKMIPYKPTDKTHESR
jgi:hypothetical protein